MRLSFTPENSRCGYDRTGRLEAAANPETIKVWRGKNLREIS
jgi:hypothetical protein